MTAIPARRLLLVGEADYRDAAEALLAGPGDAAFVVRGRLRSMVMACPDGCGETLVINLDLRAGKAWRVDMRGQGPTLFPSIWRDGGCRSHFIVWRGFILWCDRFDEDNIEPAYDPTLEDNVLAALSHERALTAEAMAAELDELIYDVDRAARRLAGKGLAQAFRGEEGWLFLRAPVSQA